MPSPFRAGFPLIIRIRHAIVPMIFLAASVAVCWADPGCPAPGPGFPSVVALTGPSLSDVQEQLLTDSFYLIVLFLNGREMTDRIATQLMRRSFVRVLFDPADRAPHDLSPDEIASIMCNVIEYDHVGDGKADPSPRRA